MTDFSNSPPVFGYFPGWQVGGGESGITVNLVYDLLCSDSLTANDVWTQVLQEPFNGSTVEEQITLGYLSMPLPYHVHSWSVA